MNSFQKVKEVCLDILFPRFCLGCGKGDQWVCKPCLESLPYRERICLQCSSSNGVAPCEICQKDREDVCILSAHDYSGFAETCVQGLKYGGITELTDSMTESLVRVWRERKMEGEFCVAAIPLHEKRMRERGYNQAELLARAFAQKVGLPYASLLHRTRATISQVELTRTQREENVLGIFCVQEECLLEPCSVVIIDDVITTGATMREAIRVLKSAGVSQACGLAFAHG